MNLQNYIKNPILYAIGEKTCFLILLSAKLCAVTVFVVRQAHQPEKNMRQRSKNAFVFL